MNPKVTHVLLLDDPLQVPPHDNGAQEALQRGAQVAAGQPGHQARRGGGQEQEVQGTVGENSGDGGRPGALRKLAGWRHVGGHGLGICRGAQKESAHEVMEKVRGAENGEAVGQAKEGLTGSSTGRMRRVGDRRVEGGVARRHPMDTGTRRRARHLG